MSMTEKLFYDLEFRKDEFKDLIYYKKIIDFWEGEEKIEIVFYKEKCKGFTINRTKEVHEMSFVLSNYIDIDLYKAITQQMKELGWLDE